MIQKKRMARLDAGAPLTINLGGEQKKLVKEGIWGKKKKSFVMEKGKGKK